MVRKLFKACVVMGKEKKQGVSMNIFCRKIPACSKQRSVMLTRVTRNFVIGMNIWGGGGGNFFVFVSYYI